MVPEPTVGLRAVEADLFFSGPSSEIGCAARFTVDAAIVNKDFIMLDVGPFALVVGVAAVIAVLVLAAGCLRKKI